MSEHKLFAFHERELRTILYKLGLLEKFEKNELKCDYCNVILSEENFGAIFKKDDKIKVICNKPECLERTRTG